MKNILVIGDVHGKVSEYYKILQNYKPEFSIQIGDFGFKKEHEWFIENIDCHANRVIFGNHDDTSFVYDVHSLNDWDYFSTFDLMTIRGANSIDKQYRTEGISWWRNEELSYIEMQEAVDNYKKYLPSIMITHDCPQSIREKVFGIQDKSLTSMGLQSMLDIHKPKLWIFGHHHKSINIMIDDVRFICLNELEVYNLEI